MLPQATPPPSRRQDLARLAEAIGAAQGSQVETEARDVVFTEWNPLDRATGGLRRGAVHEWLIEDDHPPLGVLIHLASRAIESAAPGTLILWIGRMCWPYPRAIPRPLLGRSVFVDARDTAQRVWAVDLALRSGAARAVVADASGLDMSASRRLQLAAAARDGFCLLARPWAERGELSAAWSRWRVAPALSESTSPRWAIELLRCKGMQPSEEGTHRWCVRRDHETGDVRVVPDAGDRSAATTRQILTA